MSGAKKYNLYNIEWQQFEQLCFKCLQKLISPSVAFLEGGHDQGRDFVYKGRTNYFRDNSRDINGVFQAKHKSSSSSAKSLVSELNTELTKVFIKHQKDFNLYCLVTNLAISGSVYDRLNEEFDKFLETHSELPRIEFTIISYRHIESCLDEYDSIKWSFMSVVSQADFKLALSNFIDKKTSKWIDTWISIFQANHKKFIYTYAFEAAIKKISENNILLLSGPPKCGKTFNAEALALYLITTEQFNPVKVDEISVFDETYDLNKKQVFIFDDVLGKHDLNNYRADLVDRKLEQIFEIIDENHKCIFTSREYIYREYQQRSDVNSNGKTLINKIIIEVSQLSTHEKESFFLRYYSCAFGIDDFYPSSSIINLVNHKNFSPETIRSYFENTEQFNLSAFIKHLDQPDIYLRKVFLNLKDNNRLVLLSILFSLDNQPHNISYTYEKLSSDLNQSHLIHINDQLEKLEGSILRYNTSGYEFYHPSMFDFFIQFLSDDKGMYRSLLLKNINHNLLDRIAFETKKNKKLKVNLSDIDNLITGFTRILSNPTLTVSHINGLLSWLSLLDVQLHFKIKSNSQFKQLKDCIFQGLLIAKNRILLCKNSSDLSYLIRTLKMHYNTDHLKIFFSNSSIKTILQNTCQNENYWEIVFGLAPFLSKDSLIQIVKRDWLNRFYQSLKKDINELGVELFGNAYPEFPKVQEYKRLISIGETAKAFKLKGKQISDYKKKTSKTWFTRYMECDKKMLVLKTSHPHGKFLHDLLIDNFVHLKRLEDNQRNRFITLKRKKWWL